MQNAFSCLSRQLSWSDDDDDGGGDVLMMRLALTFGVHDVLRAAANEQPQCLTVSQESIGRGALPPERIRVVTWVDPPQGGDVRRGEGGGAHLPVVVHSSWTRPCCPAHSHSGWIGRCAGRVNLHRLYCAAC